MLDALKKQVEEENFQRLNSLPGEEEIFMAVDESKYQNFLVNNYDNNVKKIIF